MISMIRNLIKLCRVSVANPDTGNFPISQIDYLEKTGKAVELYPYGMSAVAPTDCLGYVFSVLGQEENRFFIAFPNSNLRHKGLKPGEVMLGNLLTGSNVIFNENGDITVTGAKDINFNINGNVNIKSSGAVNITCPVVNVNAQNTNLGQEGSPIARQGDTIEVVISGVPYPGTITGGSPNNRST